MPPTINPPPAIKLTTENAIIIVAQVVTLDCNFIAPMRTNIPDISPIIEKKVNTQNMPLYVGVHY